MNNEPRFGIFSGSFENDALWLETVCGFSKARERMEQLASQAPGKYFVFSVHRRGLLASIDTSKLLPGEMRSPLRARR